MELKLFVPVLFLFIGLVQSQDDPPPDPDAANDDADGDKEEECEEAWEYLEFLKSEVSEPLENILQEKLFKANTIVLEVTVSNVLESTLEIRDKILDRLKNIREGKQEICKDQNVGQEDFLSMVRMEMMRVILKIIEEGEATTDRLQEIGKELLQVRIKINEEITRLIMFAERKAAPPPLAGCKRCEKFDKFVNGLKEVVDTVGAESDPPAGADDADAPPPEDPPAGETDERITKLTAVLMEIDTDVRSLYNNVFGEMDDNVEREKLYNELIELKDCGTKLNDAISAMVKASLQEDAEQVKKDIDDVIETDVTQILKDIEDKQRKCQQENCAAAPCKDCGADKLNEFINKLKEYQEFLNDGEGNPDGRIRNDLMEQLTTVNKEMTDLLKKKVNNETDGEFTDCEIAQLDVLGKIKGPLWMLVNVTIFADDDGAQSSAVIQAMLESFTVMVDERCAGDPTPPPDTPTDNCALDETNKAREFIKQIDEILSKNLFKPDMEEKCGKDTMIAYIDLKSDLEKRVKELFRNGAKCTKEIEIIKNIYVGKVTTCLAEIMDPNAPNCMEQTRPLRVQCIKDLRNSMEDRRGELLLEEIQNRIQGIQGTTSG